MKITRLLLLLLLPVLVQGQDFHTVGYFPYYRFSLKDEIAFEKLTVLNLAFLNPDSQGVWSIGGEDIDPIVQLARQVNPDIEVYISIAGGGLTQEWADAYDKFMQADKRSGFVHSLVEYVNLHQLDGVDVDLEWSFVNALYNPFVQELHDSLSTHGKGITAALPGTYRYPDVSNPTLALFDYVHMMSYDLTGPWAPNNPGPHSPTSFAQSSIDHWKNQGVPAQRLTLGVPFYGYDFSNAPTSVTAFTFSSIVAEDSAYAQMDQVGQRYYNGIPTIRTKTQMAFNQVAGIMIWEIGQDALGVQKNFSLLDAIDEELSILNDLDPSQLPSLTIYPNPFSNQLTVERSDTTDRLYWELFQIQGKVFQTGEIAPGTIRTTISTPNLPQGLYFLKLRSPSGTTVHKLLKP